MEDKKAELRLAYKEHALTRTSQSLLYCAAAILDAADQDQPLKDLGLLTKLIHPELFFGKHFYRSVKPYCTASLASHGALTCSLKR